MRIRCLHHVQLAMPEGAEDAARGFYADVLGLTEVTKPPKLAAKGGAWFAAGELKLHLGVEKDFRPARKAHPAIEVEDLSTLAQRVSEAGFDVHWDDDLPGFARFYAADPFGNRLEFLEPVG